MIKKRGIFLVLVISLVSSAVFADVIDIGTAGELNVIGRMLYGSQQNSASYVSIITPDDIQRIKPHSTADLLSTSIGIGFRSYGALGAVQNVQIRGSNSSQVQVYLDGILMDSAHEGQFDLNTIPVSSIDHVEIIRSGTGSLGKTHSVGGMVNIITKKGHPTDTPFLLSVETGSFLPEQYKDNGETKRNWIGLADTLKADLQYRNQFDELSVTGGLGIFGAQNNYTFEQNDKLKVRENASTWGLHGTASLSYDMGEAGAVSARHLTNYRHAGTPGSLSLPSGDGYQQDFVTTTSAIYQIDQVADGLLDIDVTSSYTYGRLFYYDDIFDTEDIHNKHRAFVGSDQKWYPYEWLNIDTGVSFAWDGINSTAVGTKNRYTGSIHGAGSIYLDEKNISIHPMVRADSTNDFGFAPSASIGAIYTLDDNLSIQANMGYSHRPPSFSDLYWESPPFMFGNPDLTPEKSWMIDIGYIYEGVIDYEGTLFIRDTYNLIQWAEQSGSWVPENIGKALFLGTEQDIDWAVTDQLAVSAGYLLNYSWDLSGENTLSSDIRVAHVRMHTLHAGVSYRDDTFDISVDGQYLGKNHELDAVFLIDAVVNWRADDTLSFYAAVDNLFNTRYEFADGYPMPGTQIRLGTTVMF